MALEAKLKTALGLSFVKSKGNAAGGCISEGKTYETNEGLIFVKVNNNEKSKIMFEGEIAGLKAIEETDTVRVPKPLKVIELNSSGKTALVMEYLEMSSLSTMAEKLGEELAKMHLHNANLKSPGTSIHKLENSHYIKDFGFHVTTCCGYIPQNNSWKSDWVEFYVQQRLDHQMKLIEIEYGDREAKELWSELILKLPIFFKNLEITPALLHGDLWSGNVAQTSEGPVIYDPAVFYGHSEYELSIAEMFGGFPKAFYNAYHNLIPKQPGFEKRRDVYKLFHCLNHWNHFGGGYRSSSISIMKRLLKDS